MNGDEIQYALDRRNHVQLDDGDNVIYKPIQLGHLTGDVIIEALGNGAIGYLGPPGRAVFEYSYTGVQDPPRVFFKHVQATNTGTATYNKSDIAFFRVVQPNTSPKAIYAEHCSLSNNGTYLFDGPDVSGCDGIQIKHCTGGGSGYIRWKLRHAAKMLFLEIYDTRYLTQDKIGPSIDLKNVRGAFIHVYTDEIESNIHPELLGNVGMPLAYRLVNPRGYNRLEHNWNEYQTNWDVNATGCWGTSIRVDDTSGDYGMHFVRRYETSMRGGTSTGEYGVQLYGGHDSANAGSLYVEQLDSFGIDRQTFGGKCYPKIIDGWDLTADEVSDYTDANAGGVENRLSVYDEDGQPRKYGNTRTGIYNTEYRLDRTIKAKDYETILSEQSKIAYGGINSTIAVDGSDLVITFTGNDTLHVTEEIQVEYLIVGGGGSGGAVEDGTSQQGGGGGAGGYTSNFGGTKVTLAAGDYPVVVGAGGVYEWGTFGSGVDGGSSSFNGITMQGGGGGGGSSDGVTFDNGRAGGSGGGGAARGGVSGGSGTAYGNSGGGSTESAGNPSGGGGGGGAGGAGTDGTYTTVPVGGNGGAGIANAITGTSIVYAEGGGGGSLNANNQGQGGVGDSGWPRTSTPNSKQRDGSKNRGSGGGGGAPLQGSLVSYPGNGGDGVVIIRVTGA